MNSFRFRMDVVIRKIDEIVQYLEPNRKFINAHMVDFLVTNHWDRFIPKHIQQEIKTNQDIDEAIEIFWNQNDNQQKWHKYPAFQEFLVNSKKHQLVNYFSIDEAKNYLKFMDKNCLNTKGFMTEKKSHEVEISASLMDSIAARVAENERLPKEDVVVIDAGDGKGYLSSRIALEFGIKVLGVDANQSNTMGAETRNQILQVFICLKSILGS